MKQLACIFLFCLLLSGCEKPFCQKETSDEVSGIALRVVGDGTYLAYQEGVGDLNRNGMHISTETEYQQVFNYCCAGRLESIDFTQYDVLGLSTVNRGTRSTYLRDVQIDEKNKKVVYTVTERYCRRSSPVLGQGNFVLVPKLPSGYTIEYIRNQ